MINDTIAYTLAGSMLLNIGFAALTLFRGVGPKRVLFIKSGRTIIPKPLKMGQKEFKWKRQDGSTPAFPLKAETAQPYGKRGTCWIVDDANGEFLSWDASGMRLPFDHNYYGEALSDTREIKWFRGQAQADKAQAKPMLMMLIVLGVIGFFLFQKFGGHG